MFVSVIVPVYNGADTIGECITALLDQTVPQSEYEIIVVDDGSTDGTREVVEGYNVRLLSQPNRGPGAARNLGVSQARGEILLFTDADCRPVREWIEEMVRPLLESDVVAVKGAYRTAQTSLMARFVQAEFEERYELLAKRQYIDFVDTHSAAYRKREFLAANGFDCALPISQDVELAYRLSRQGHKMVFNPRAIVYHHHPESCLSYFKAKFRRAYWRTITYPRHPEKMVKDSYTPQVMKVQIGLVYFLGLALSGALIMPEKRSGLLWGVALVLLLFGVTTVPFALRAARADRLVGLVSPVFLFLRAVALGLGFAAGWISVLSRRLTGAELVSS